MSRILLSRTDAIGDLILTLPVARSIAEKYPEHHVTMLVSDYTEQLLAGEEYVDGIMTIHGREPATYYDVKELGHWLRMAAFDTVVFFYPRFSLAVAARKGRISERVGSAYRLYSFMFNRRIKQHRKNSGKHELDLNYDLAEAVFPGLARHEPQLSVLDGETTSASEILASKGIEAGETYVIVHPFSRGSAPNWRIDNYLSLVGQMVESGVKVVVTGSAIERQLFKEPLESLPKNVVNLVGETELRHLKGLIKNAAMVVTSSTGPIHIATAVGTFAVGIYPPESALSPVRWGPRGGASKLFVPDPASEKQGTTQVMDAIKVETVLTFILAKLHADIRLRK